MVLILLDWRNGQVGIGIYLRLGKLDKPPSRRDADSRPRSPHVLIARPPIPNLESPRWYS
jgi:hypothetical protein